MKTDILKFSLKFIEEMEKKISKMKMMDRICDLSDIRPLQNHFKMLIEFWSVDMVKFQLYLFCAEFMERC